MEKSPEPRASLRLYRIVYANVRGLHENLSDLSLTVRGGDVFFFILRLLSLPGTIFPSSWFRVSVDRCSCS